MNKYKYILVIPLYNEEGAIPNLIKQINKFSKGKSIKIIIVNDGSTDKSLKKLYENKNKKILILNKKNEGHGKTVIFAFKNALKFKADFILMCDSDDQINIAQFSKLEKFKSNSMMVSGVRYNRNDPFIRILITNILKIIILFFFFRYIPDSNCPFRIINYKFLKKNIKKIKNSFLPNILLSILAASQKKLKNIKIKHKERSTGSSINFLNVFKLGLLGIKELIIFKKNLHK
jgi:dolichol-phosphate mannosyltransferase